MSDVESALHDIARMREQLAASSRFQGLAPGVVALTGCFAFALGAWQHFAGEDDLLIWILNAAVCALMIGTEAIARVSIGVQTGPLIGAQKGPPVRMAER